MQRQDEDRAKMEQASELVSEVEQYKQMEVDLRDQLTKVGSPDRLLFLCVCLFEVKDQLIKVGPVHQDRLLFLCFCLFDLREQLDKVGCNP